MVLYLFYVVRFGDREETRVNFQILSSLQKKDSFIISFNIVTLKVNDNFKPFSIECYANAVRVFNKHFFLSQGTSVSLKASSYL